MLTSLPGARAELRGPEEGEHQAEEGGRQQGVREEEGQGQDREGRRHRGNQSPPGPRC